MYQEVSSDYEPNSQRLLVYWWWDSNLYWRRERLYREAYKRRTFGEHHPVAHNPKNRFPSPYLDNEGKKERRRKRRAYGSQGWKGWGGEIYFKRFGEIMIDCVNKRKARQLIKKQIREELRNEL